LSEYLRVGSGLSCLTFESLTWHQKANLLKAAAEER